MNKKYAGLDFSAWFDGKDVNEAAFCREFLSKNKLIYAGAATSALFEMKKGAAFLVRQDQQNDAQIFMILF